MYEAISIYLSIYLSMHLLYTYTCIHTYIYSDAACGSVCIITHTHTHSHTLMQMLHAALETLEEQGMRSVCEEVERERVALVHERARMQHTCLREREQREALRLQVTNVC